MSNWIADQVGNAAGGLMYYFGGGAGEQARGNAADAQLAALNSKEYGRGGRIYNEITDQRGAVAADVAYGQTQKNLETGATGDVLAQLMAEGRAGANDGLAGLWNGIGKALLGLLGLFPWWLWLAAGAAAFFYLGGGRILKRELARRTA